MKDLQPVHSKHQITGLGQIVEGMIITAVNDEDRVEYITLTTPCMGLIEVVPVDKLIGWIKGENQTLISLTLSTVDYCLEMDNNETWHPTNHILWFGKRASRGIALMIRPNTLAK